jgi:hypothetical protein
MADTRKACCRPEAGNLERVTSVRMTQVLISSNGRLPVNGTETCDRCRVCGCRHFEFSVDPGHFKTRGAQAG